MPVPSSRPPVVLASRSPRRIELLRQLVPEFEIVPADLDEAALTMADPFETARSLALAKAQAVARRRPGALVIGSDTVVALPSGSGYEQFAQPKDEADAFRILASLRGKTHLVITGVAVWTEGAAWVAHDTAEVEFEDVTDESIWDYIKTQEPMDKAGAYGAQGMGRFLVRELRGDRLTVIGFPLNFVEKLLIESGYLPEKSPRG